MLPLNRRHQQWTNHSMSSITVTLSKLGQKNESWSPIVRQSYRWHKEKYAKYSLGLVQYSLSLHARSRLSLPTMHIDYIIHDLHWLSMACVRSESDENRGKCKTTLHDDHAAADQMLDGDIRVWFPTATCRLHHAVIWPWLKLDHSLKLRAGSWVI